MYYKTSKDTIIKIVVLGTLTCGDKNLDGILKSINQFSYPLMMLAECLSDLTFDGHVETIKRECDYLYSITEKGDKYFLELVKDYDNMREMLADYMIQVVNNQKR